MQALLIIIYLLALPVLTYHKYCTVLDVFEKPPLYNKPHLYVIFSTIRLVLSWGSIVGIWYYFGLTSGIVAFILYFLISTISLRIFYNKQLKTWYKIFITIIEEEPTTYGDGKDQSPEKKHAEALRLAKQAVDKAIKGETL